MSRDLVRIGTEPLSLDAAMREFIGYPTDGAVEGVGDLDREAGAMVAFAGCVREMEGGTAIPALEYEHYPGMAEREMAALAARARERWPVHRVALLHRIGPVAVGEPSVLVIVTAGHRAEAFEAARFLIDELKLSVPIWKAAGK